MAMLPLEPGAILARGALFPLTRNRRDARINPRPMVEEKVPSPTLGGVTGPQPQPRWFRAKDTAQLCPRGQDERDKKDGGRRPDSRPAAPGDADARPSRYRTEGLNVAIVQTERDIGDGSGKRESIGDVGFLPPYILHSVTRPAWV